MSSFKRKATGKQVLNVYPGTRISPASNLSLITSTGISSLDDILGGGLPLSCSLVFAAPDIHSSYGDLIQKYFIAQGLASGHRVCLVTPNPREFLKDLMWSPKGSQSSTAVGDASAVDSDGEEEKDGDDQDSESKKVKIAWRYEKMKQFKTTVGTSAGANSDREVYCQNFDLSCTIPEEVISDALRTDRLHLLEVSVSGTSGCKTGSALTPTAIVGEIIKFVSSGASAPVRICIPSLGCSAWGDLSAKVIFRFLHSLKAILRDYNYSCASTTLPPSLSAKLWGGPGWLEKVGWASDCLLTLSAFTANPGMSSIFPSHHGLLQTHTLPAPFTFSPPSDRFSTLRGLTSSGENNLAFKCTRRRLIFETLHLDVEGGTGERRTTASKLMDDGVPVGTQKDTETKPKIASVEVQMEGVFEEKKSPVVKKKKRAVAFQSDRPELYEF
ncbi:Elongator complex protein 4 [Crepidotus variabilis]|uniref:Elongator complex protein 4 n=1 Tax=Crepidotus variabilis TaxID=179855 RepID=A0A9P6EV11_9AGAR|nr:Elongator complex protein 4 [Crepidotus variabilis]